MKDTPASRREVNQRTAIIGGIGLIIFLAVAASNVTLGIVVILVTFAVMLLNYLVWQIAVWREKKSNDRRR